MTNYITIRASCDTEWTHIATYYETVLSEETSLTATATEDSQSVSKNSRYGMTAVESITRWDRRDEGHGYKYRVFQL